MKYTKYLINGNFFDTRVLEQMPKVLFPLSIGAAIVGIVVIGTAIPLSITADGLRSVKYHLILFERKHRIVRKVQATQTYVFIDSNNKSVNKFIVRRANNVNNFLKKAMEL